MILARNRLANAQKCIYVVFIIEQHSKARKPDSFPMRVSGFKGTRTKSKRLQSRGQFKDGDLGAQSGYISSQPRQSKPGWTVTVLAFIAALCAFQFTSHLPKFISGSVMLTWIDFRKAIRHISDSLLIIDPPICYIKSFN